jgi:hypothetical protein
MDGLNEIAIDPHEMLRLRDMLDVAGVEYERGDGYIGDDSWRTYSADFKVVDDRCAAGFSCVLHQFSYGHQDGLLELWAHGMEGPCGYLSAENVMDRLRKAGMA